MRESVTSLENESASKALQKPQNPCGLSGIRRSLERGQIVENAVEIENGWSTGNEHFCHDMTVFI